MNFFVCKPVGEEELPDDHEEIEELAAEEDEGVSVVLVLQVLPEGLEQRVHLGVHVLDDPGRFVLGQVLHQAWVVGKRKG